MSNLTIKGQTESAIRELLEAAKLKKGDLVVIGCSSSEIVGQKIGKGSNPEAAKEVADTVMPILQSEGLLLAAQCCEHLNRALIVERETAEKFGYEIVCVRPQPKAGGSFATAVYNKMRDPVAVEFIKASAGLDIGGTLIGMHLKHVAVPLRLETKYIGEATVQAAGTRPKLIGGERAVYPDWA
ncbi:MAG: TIGR01440 family protein [Oscillospiraceae bacterium]